MSRDTNDRAATGELKRLATNVSWTSLATLSRLLVGLVQVRLVTGYLGTSGYGRLAVIMSTTGLVTLVFSMRVWEWVTKLLAEATTRDDGVLAGSVVRFGLIASALVNAVAIFCVLCASRFVATRFLHAPSSWPWVAAYSGTLLSSWVTDTSGATLRTLGYFRFLAFFNVAGACARVAILVSGLHLGYGLPGVVVGYLISETIINGVTVLVAARAFRERFGVRFASGSFDVIRPRWSEIKAMLSYAFVVDTMKSFASQADVLVLGAFASPSAVGAYRVAQTVVDAANRVPDAILSSAYPQIARIIARNDVGALKHLLGRSSSFVAAGAIPACALVTWLAPEIVTLVGGPEFTASAPILQMLIWSVVWCIAYWATPSAVSVGRSNWAFHLYATILALKLVLVVPLTARWGGVGLAATNVAFYVGYVALGTVYLRRVLRTMKERAAAA